MAEEAPDIQNKKLLVIAIALALVVVVVYNLHVSRVRKAAVGDMITLLVLSHDMQAGEAITPKDIKYLQIGEQVVKHLGSCVTEDDYDYVVQEAVLNQSVVKDQILMEYHITPGAARRGQLELGPGNVAVTLKIDPDLALGDVLGVGNWVNVVAYLEVEGGPLQAWTIIEGVRVVAIGGVGRKDTAVGNRRVSARDRMRSFRSVTIEVDEQESLKLANVISHARDGRVWLVLRSQPTGRETETLGKVNENLGSLVDRAADGS